MNRNKSEKDQFGKGTIRKMILERRNLNKDNPEKSEKGQFCIEKIAKGQFGKEKPEKGQF